MIAVVVPITITTLAITKIALCRALLTIIEAASIRDRCAKSKSECSCQLCKRKTVHKYYSQILLSMKNGNNSNIIAVIFKSLANDLCTYTI